MLFHTEALIFKCAICMKALLDSVTTLQEPCPDIHSNLRLRPGQLWAPQTWRAAEGRATRQGEGRSTDVSLEAPPKRPRATGRFVWLILGPKLHDKDGVTAQKLRASRQRGRTLATVTDTVPGDLRTRRRQRD